MTSSSASPHPVTRALPRRTEDNVQFFDSCMKHAMELQQCDDCGAYRYYPGPVCPKCGSPRFAWKPVSGRGTVYSFTWVHRPAPGFEDKVPYAYGLVQLVEGPVMPTDIVECSESQLAIDLPVEVVYEDVTDDISLPLFKPTAPEQR
jgi:uncharacterized OB-fold protein